MGFGWQDIAALLGIAAAAAYLLRRVFGARAGSAPAGCADCSGCADSMAERRLISIAPPRGRKGPERGREGHSAREGSAREVPAGEDRDSAT